MKRGFGWILAWLGVVCLLLSLGLEASPHHERHVAENRSGGRSRELVCLSSYRIWRSTSTKLIRSRAGTRESFFTPGLFLSADNVGPMGAPWLDDRGPPGTRWGPQASCKAAGHAGSPKQGIESAYPPKFLLGNGPN